LEAERLRNEQEQEYHQAMLQDQSNAFLLNKLTFFVVQEQKKEREIREKERQENEEVEKQRNSDKQFDKQKAEGKEYFSTHNQTSGPDSVVLAIRLASGERIKRSFLKTDSIDVFLFDMFTFFQIVYLFTITHMAKFFPFRLVVPTPRAILPQDGHSISEHGITKPTLIIQETIEED
jgi:hypothetical protein